MRARSFPAFAIVLALAGGLLGCGRDHGRTALLAPEGGDNGGGASLAGLVVLPFDPGAFAGAVDHPYFPLVPGTTFRYAGETDEGEEVIVVEVLRNRKRILGVDATVVRDRVYLEGELIEDTFDWYAQDEQGNVWYLGEDTREYEEGEVVSTEGSWEAGVGGARPGVVMLASPRVGDSYAQEEAPGVAEDMAKILSLKETASVPAGDYEGCLQTAEWTPLEPGHREFKYYAPGIGLVLEVASRGGGQRVELTSVSR